MKKIVAFGDSFINYYWSTVPPVSWVSDLGNKLNLPVLNYGCAGSSHTYSFHKFCEYYQSQEYHREDIIIFQTSHLYSRAYAVNMVPYLSVAVNQQNNPSYSKKERKWIDKNLESYFWHIEHTAHCGLNYDLVQMLSFFQIWAMKNKTNKFIFLRGFSNCDPPIEKLNYIITPTENFLPVISENNVLFKISSEEFSNTELFDIALNDWDKRINHLTKVNREILIQIIFDMLETNSVKPFDSKKFLKNIYTTKDDVRNLSKLETPE